jgi:mono/diheme cytochrome c family protein
MKRLFVLVALICSCADDPTQPRWEFVPDMVDSLAVEAFTAGMRAPPPGTVARGQLPLRYGATPEEAARAGRELESPIPSHAGEAARGKQQFDIHCAHCHGTGGLGDGPVVPRFPAPPSTPC